MIVGDDNTLVDVMQQVARMQRSVIRDLAHTTPYYAALHAGYFTVTDNLAGVILASV